ncbi:MAG TPA: hypothetical protein VFQ60_03290 [Patescibacteria group bacterium]|nr:hypothetical protein [Patescibacteria group bacterium]
MPNNEPTNREILEAINDFANHVELELGTLASGIGTLTSGVGILKSEVGALKSEVETLKSDVQHVKAVIVTKPYLDDKLADLRGDLVRMVKQR